MRLEDFVTETLNEVMQGVRNAQKRAVELGGAIAPSASIDMSQPSGGRARLYDSHTGDALQEVAFDVAVTTTEGKATEGGIGEFVGSIGLGSKGRSEAESTSVSRIKFSVPVRFPSGQQ